MARKVGVREISRMTGFSPATVSNALNHRRNVSKKTIEIITKTAQDLGYERPSNLSQISFVLARKTGKVLDEGTFHQAVIEGVERAARERNFQTTYISLDLADRDAAAHKAYEITHDIHSAVVLLGTEMTEDDYQLFADHVVPLVVVDGWSDHLFFECIVTANENSAFRAVSYLAQMGHRDIGYIAGSYRIKNFPLRERGYRRAMREAGIKINPQYRVEVGTTVTTAHDDMSAWLATRPELPTAFFVENDIMALGCMRAMNESGIKIPEDVSMFGFDDLTFARIANPPLSTIRVPNRAMGELAVELIMDHLRAPRSYSRVTHLSTELVKRQSVRELN